MTQINLLGLLEGLSIDPSMRDVPISGIAVDSRRVQPGDLFVATSDREDGHQYIPDAIKNGAVAVMGSKPQTLSVPYVQVADTRLTLAEISARFYDFPANDLVMIGVTGSDGKTTTVNFIYQILKAAGLPAGMISTVNAVIGDETLDTGLHVTTPEAFEVQHYLRRMADAGLEFAVLETTSHGLAARRVQGKDFDIGVITNITHEHLDYHGSWEAYMQAKARLVEGLSALKHKQHTIPPLAVLNRDDRSYPHLVARVHASQITYGQHPEADVRADQIENTPEYLRFVAR
ncbi:MAG: Mur ligase family protein, partial [Anaerolineales bacterium]